MHFQLQRHGHRDGRLLAEERNLGTRGDCYERSVSGVLPDDQPRVRWLAPVALTIVPALECLGLAVLHSFFSSS